jgi:hypothetical protein
LIVEGIAYVFAQYLCAKATSLPSFKRGELMENRMKRAGVPFRDNQRTSSENEEEEFSLLFPGGKTASREKERKSLVRGRMILLIGIVLLLILGIMGVSLRLSGSWMSSVSKKWSYQTGAGIYSSPTVVNGIIYVSSQSGNLYALDAVSGHEKWSYHLTSEGTSNPSSPTVTNGIVYVSPLTGKLYALDAVTGSEKWSYQIGDAVYSSPTVVNGILYIGSAPHKSLHVVGESELAKGLANLPGHCLHSS